MHGLGAKPSIVHAADDGPVEIGCCTCLGGGAIDDLADWSSLAKPLGGSLDALDRAQPSNRHSPSELHRQPAELLRFKAGGIGTTTCSRQSINVARYRLRNGVVELFDLLRRAGRPRSTPLGDQDVQAAMQVRILQATPKEYHRDISRATTPSGDGPLGLSLVESRQAVVADLLPRRGISNELMSRWPNAGVTVDRGHSNHRDLPGFRIPREQVRSTLPAEGLRESPRGCPVTQRLLAGLDDERPRRQSR